MRRLTISLFLGIVVVMTLPSVTVAADPWVRNVDQGTTGGSLGADVTIRDLVIRGGLAPDSSLRGGGGIRNHGDLTVIDSVIRDNRAGPQGLGGGILNIGDLVVFDSLIRENRAFRGGGIDTREIAGVDPTPTLSIGGTRIIRNRAEFGGGGIANVHTGEFEITNTNIRDNTAGQEGGGVANYDGGVVTFLGVNFSGNDPDDCFGTPPC